MRCNVNNWLVNIGLKSTDQQLKPQPDAQSKIEFSEVDDIVRPVWRHTEAGRNARLAYKQIILFLLDQKRQRACPVVTEVDGPKVAKFLVG